MKFRSLYYINRPFIINFDDVEMDYLVTADSAMAGDSVVSVVISSNSGSS